MMRYVVFAHVFSTLAMVGVVWFVQLVHYPMFAAVGQTSLAEYHSAHMRRTSWLIVPLMLVEAVTGGLLVWQTPLAISSLTIGVASVLLALVWISTFAVQVPLHNRLSRNTDRTTIQLLVTTNWVRTILWTLRGVLVGWMVVRILV